MSDPVYMPIDDLRRHWGPIEAMLHRVRDRMNEDWLPEDVYAQAIMGKAGIYVAFDEGTRVSDPRPVGVIVLEKLETWGVSVCHVWAVFHMDKSRTIKDYWPWVKQTARDMGCERVRFSGRRGYERVLNLTAARVVYEAEV